MPFGFPPGGEVTPEQLQPLADRLQQLERQVGRDGNNQTFLTSVLQMQRAWQDTRVDNVDAAHPLRLSLFIPPDTKLVQRAILRFKLLGYRTFANPTTGTLGITDGQTPIGVTVVINNTDQTSVLKGPFNADQDALDITRYLKATGWNTIELGAAGLGRIDASVFLEIYLPSLPGRS